MTWARVAAENFSLTKGTLKKISKTPGVTRGFCGNCGTTITYDSGTAVEGQDWSGDAWFSAVTLDDPAVVEPRSHVFMSHKQPWIHLADGLPTFDEF